MSPGLKRKTSDVRTYFELNKNDNVLSKCVGCIKIVLTEKFTALNAYIKNKRGLKSMI